MLKEEEQGLAKSSRRQVLKWSTGTALGLLAFAGRGRASELACGLTPAQAEGPFYPDEQQADEDADLTHIAGQRGRASGTIIVIEGQVTDEACTPIKGALVEIWQAGANGRYHHRGDAENPKPLDPNFQYWGKSVSDDEGRYCFKTVIPGHYYADSDWVRPPHIHFKVIRRGYHELITQMYFAGNQYNEGDRLLRRIPAGERERVVIELDEQVGAYPKAVFPISLARVL